MLQCTQDLFPIYKFKVKIRNLVAVPLLWSELLKLFASLHIAFKRVYNKSTIQMTVNAFTQHLSQQKVFK